MTVTSVRMPNGTRVLKGADKVAALLLAMGKPVAGRLLKHFDPLELRLIIRSASELGAVPTPVLEALVEEFSSHFSNGLDLLGNAGEAEQLLNGAFPPEQVADILSDVLGSSNSGMWDKLAAVPEALFATYLLKEHPQTAAYILSKLSTAAAAKISAQIPRDFRNQVMRRMLSLEPVQESTLRCVEDVLQEDLLEGGGAAAGANPHSRMANIINQLEPDQIEDVLQSAGRGRPKEAEALRELLFTFDDMLKLSSQARTTLFDKHPRRPGGHGAQRHRSRVSRRLSCPRWARAPAARRERIRRRHRRARARHPKARRAIADSCSRWRTQRNRNLVRRRRRRRLT